MLCCYEMNVLRVLNIHNAFLTVSGWLFKYIHSVFTIL